MRLTEQFTYFGVLNYGARYYILRLIPVKARRTYVLTQLIVIGVRKIVNALVFLKQRFGHDIDPRIGALRRKLRCYQKLVRRGIIQRALRVGIRFLKLLHYKRRALFFCHIYPLPV